MKRINLVNQYHDNSAHSHCCQTAKRETGASKDSENIRCLVLKLADSV